MKTNVVAAMAKIILAAEERQQFTLLERDRQVLHTALVDFVNRAADKFVLGARENGGTIMSRPAVPELENELIDAWMYKTALQFMMKGL